MLACDGGEETLHSSDSTRLDGPQFWNDWGVGLSLPTDAVSVTVTATGLATEVMSFRVLGDGDRLLVDGDAPEASLNRVLRGRGTAVGSIPSSSAALPLGRSLIVMLQMLPPAPPGPRPTGNAWVKRAVMGPAVPAVQELPVTLVLATAAPPGLDEAMGVLRRIWRTAGIEVRPPTKVQVTGPALVTVDPQLGSDSPMVGEALRLSKAAPEGTLALVVVGDLSLPGGDLGLWALSGSIPVPPVQGTPRSGVLVSAAFLRKDPTLGGQILAHEVGHALGLYHTTERPLIGGAPIHDQLDDTVACPASADRDGDQFLDAAECAGHDTGNLMFWATPRGATALTPGQAEMARRSALVR